MKSKLALKKFQMIKPLGKYWTFIELDAETGPEHEQTITNFTLKEATE